MSRIITLFVTVEFPQFVLQKNTFQEKLRNITRQLNLQISTKNVTRVG